MQMYSNNLTFVWSLPSVYLIVNSDSASFQKKMQLSQAHTATV